MRLIKRYWAIGVFFAGASVLALLIPLIFNDPGKREEGVSSEDAHQPGSGISSVRNPGGEHGEAKASVRSPSSRENRNETLRQYISRFREVSKVDPPDRRYNKTIDLMDEAVEALEGVDLLILEDEVSPFCQNEFERMRLRGMVGSRALRKISSLDGVLDYIERNGVHPDVASRLGYAYTNYFTDLLKVVSDPVARDKMAYSYYGKKLSFHPQKEADSLIEYAQEYGAYEMLEKRMKNLPDDVDRALIEERLNDAGEDFAEARNIVRKGRLNAGGEDS